VFGDTQVVVLPTWVMVIVVHGNVKVLVARPSQQFEFDLVRVIVTEETPTLSMTVAQTFLDWPATLQEIAVHPPVSLPGSTLLMVGGVVSDAWTTTVRCTWVAALYVALPAWFALITQLPAPM
jgi:hypothetical protein